MSINPGSTQQPFTRTYNNGNFTITHTLDSPDAGGTEQNTWTVQSDSNPAEHMTLNKGTNVNKGNVTYWNQVENKNGQYIDFQNIIANGQDQINGNVTTQTLQLQPGETPDLAQAVGLEQVLEPTLSQGQAKGGASPYFGQVLEAALGILGM